MKRVFWLIYGMVCSLCIQAQTVESYFAGEEHIVDTLYVVAVDTVLATDTVVSDTVVGTSTPVDVGGMSGGSPVDHWRNMRVNRIVMRKELRDTRRDLRREFTTTRDSAKVRLKHYAQLHPHELRIGWGDQMFEHLVWRELNRPTIWPGDYEAWGDEHFRYTQHWFLEYQYRVQYWFSIGAQVDYSSVYWDRVLRNGQGIECQREPNHMFANVAVIPTIRFSYVHRKYLTMYSALGAGLNVNTGTEQDYKGRTTALVPVMNITYLGVSVGNSRWFGAVELGGLYSLMSLNEIYMLGSRIFTASVGMRL